MTRDDDLRRNARLAVLERDVAVYIADCDVDSADAIATVVADSDFVGTADEATVGRALRERMLSPDAISDDGDWEADE